MPEHLQKVVYSLPEDGADCASKLRGTEVWGAYCSIGWYTSTIVSPLENIDCWAQNSIRPGRISRKYGERMPLING